MTCTKPLAIFGILLSTLSAGCVLEDLDIGSDVQAICPPQDCGNSAMSNGYPASELNQDSRWSTQGFRILGYTDDAGIPLTVDVHDSEFYLLGATAGIWAPFRSATSAIIIHLERDNGDPMTPEYHSIRVEVAPWLDSWAKPGTSIPAYYMSYEDQSVGDRGWLPFCSKIENGMEIMTRAVLIVGERYDLDAREVLPHVGDESRWYNIACEAGALLKNKRLGYDPEVTTLGVTTSPDQRQATWRMMNAVYCGDGVSYTTNGTPLNWQNEYNWFAPPHGSLEAAWGPDGAICLDNPRHPELWNPDDCAIPRCHGVVPAGAMWWTTNPP